MLLNTNLYTSGLVEPDPTSSNVAENTGPDTGAADSKMNSTNLEFCRSPFMVFAFYDAAPSRYRAFTPSRYCAVRGVRADSKGQGSRRA